MSEKTFKFVKLPIERVNEILETMVEIAPLSGSDFVTVRDMLTRVSSVGPKLGVLEQQCVVLNKGNRQFIAHLNELKLLDGLDVTMSEFSLATRNSIVHLLLQWNLVEVANCDMIEQPVLSKRLYVAKYHDIAKGNVKLVQSFRPFQTKD